MQAVDILRLIGNSRKFRHIKHLLIGGGGRYRIPETLGVAGFLRALDERRCSYVVLRWFEQLPTVEKGEDIDILVADADVEKVTSLVVRSSSRRQVACDIYSVHGLPGTSYRGTACYPPLLATQILERAVRHASGVSVPCPEDHFLSLAFHALYHKGYASGLPVSRSEGPRNDAPEHPYAEALASLASPLNISVPITMEDLIAELQSRGWHPPADTLVKWSRRNPFCHDLAREAHSGLEAPPGLAVLVVRDAGAGAETLGSIARIVVEQGFEVLALRPLDAEQRARASSLLRGGNWDRGPYPRSGGAPSVLIVARDPQPRAASAALQTEHPGIDNARLVDLKYRIRDWWNARQPPAERCNIVHSSDSAVQAIHYLQLLMPGQEAIAGLGADPGSAMGNPKGEVKPHHVC